MAAPRWPEDTFIDPHMPPDNHGLRTPWHATPRKLDKNGRRRLVWVWPKDKERGQFGRLKDVLTKKGPGIWIARDGGGPHRPIWSNWTNLTPAGFGFDNLGYRDERDELNPIRDHRIKYDFLTRKYKPKNMNMWSDVKWRRGSNPAPPWYYRDAVGIEHFEEVDPTGRNPFRYDENTPYWDWARPSPNHFYYLQYMPGAPWPPQGPF
jgi:hypothetical protein